MPQNIVNYEPTNINLNTQQEAVSVTFSKCEIVQNMSWVRLLSNFIVWCWLINARGWLKKATRAPELDNSARYPRRGAPLLGYFQHVTCRYSRAARAPSPGEFERELPGVWPGQRRPSRGLGLVNHTTADKENWANPTFKILCLETCHSIAMNLKPLKLLVQMENVSMFLGNKS